jgi:hypothetical protein
VALFVKLVAYKEDVPVIVALSTVSTERSSRSLRPAHPERTMLIARIEVKNILNKPFFMVYPLFFKK